MAITALQTAATGMKALDTALDVAANNLANVNTVGFKRSRTNFEDLLYQIRREPGIRNLNDEPVPHGIQVGLGVMVSGTQLNFEKGSVDNTGKELDVMIDGEGFFQVTANENGNQITAYTRAGNFVQNSQGNLVLANSAGSQLDPSITIPTGTVRVVIGRNGDVQVLQQGQTNLSTAGTIQLARFVNPEGLRQLGKNLYAETEASGTPVTGQPEQDGFGAVVQGSLENSNVDPVRELIDLIRTQRAFELNSQAIESADQALQTVTNLRRF